MFIEERHKAILELLRERGSITTSIIQRKFGVGYDSAKRDLRILEEKGLLKRTHGGAIPVEASLPEAAAGTGQGAVSVPADRLVRDSGEADIITRYAASLINDGETVFISSDELGYALAANLPDRLRARIVTNSLKLANLLEKRQNLNVWFAGGELHGGRCGDSFAVAMLRRIWYDCVFIGAEGLTPEFGLSVSDGSELAVYETIIPASKRVVGLALSTDIGRNAPISLCAADRLGCIVTDAGCAGDKLVPFDKLGVHTVIAEQEAD